MCGLDICFFSFGFESSKRKNSRTDDFICQKTNSLLKMFAFCSYVDWLYFASEFDFDLGKIVHHKHFFPCASFNSSVSFFSLSLFLGEWMSYGCFVVWFLSIQTKRKNSRIDHIICPKTKNPIFAFLLDARCVRNLIGYLFVCL